MQCGVEERMIRRQKVVVVECFKYRERGHKCREYPLWKRTKEERRLRRSLIEELRKRAEEHCGRGIPKETHLLELGWYTREVIVTYVECERCGEKGCHMEENRGQEVISNRQRWCGYQKRKEEEAAHGQENWKVQQKKGVVKGRYKRTVLFLPLNRITTLWSSLSLFKYY